MDAMYSDLNGKIEQLNSHVKKLDIQVAQTAESVRRQEGFLPGKTDVNPRQHVNAITLSSEKQVEPVPKSGMDDEGFVALEEVEENESFGNAEKGVTANSPNGDCRPVQLKPELLKQPEPTPERVYIPKVPYPKPPKKSKKEMEDATCKAMLEKLMVELPFVDAIKTSSAFKRYIKKLVAGSLSIEEGVMTISKEVSAVLINKMPEKLPDPGSFVLNCSIFADRFEHSLCDLGSGVNLMPFSVAKRMGFTDFKPTRVSLILADRSVRYPEGLLEDVPVKIGECFIPADFIVLRYDEEPKDPILLGRPFLATAGAMIDCKNGKIALNIGDLEMKFSMDRTMKRPTIDGQTFFVDTLTDVAEDPLETAWVCSITSKHHLDDTAAGAEMKEDQEIPKVIPPIAIQTDKESAKFKSKETLCSPDLKVPKVKQKITSKPFVKVSILVPLDLREANEDVIKEKLQKTKELFPKAAWEQKEGMLVARRKLNKKQSANFFKDKGNIPLKDPPRT